MISSTYLTKLLDLHPVGGISDGQIVSPEFSSTTPKISNCCWDALADECTKTVVTDTRTMTIKRKLFHLSRDSAHFCPSCYVSLRTFPAGFFLILPSPPYESNQLFVTSNSPSSISSFGLVFTSPMIRNDKGQNLRGSIPKYGRSRILATVPKGTQGFWNKNWHNSTEYPQKVGFLLACWRWIRQRLWLWLSHYDERFRELEKLLAEFQFGPYGYLYDCTRVLK